VKRALARMTEVGLSGAKFLPEQTPQSPTSGVSALPASAGSSSPSTPTTTAQPSVQSFVNVIKSYFPADVFDPQVNAVRSDIVQKIGDDPKAQVEALIYNTALQNLCLAYERTYNAIFGSQLRLLDHMRLVGPLTVDDVRAAYELATSQSLDPIITPFEKWIGFLTSNNLVRLTMDRYEITNNGIAFLKYVFDRRLTLQKFF
jgi:hypothetical protein